MEVLGIVLGALGVLAGGVAIVQAHLSSRKSDRALDGLEKGQESLQDAQRTSVQTLAELRTFQHDLAIAQQTLVGIALAQSWPRFLDADAIEAKPAPEIHYGVDHAPALSAAPVHATATARPEADAEEVTTEALKAKLLAAVTKAPGGIPAAALVEATAGAETRTSIRGLIVLRMQGSVTWPGSAQDLAPDSLVTATNA